MTTATVEDLRPVLTTPFPNEQRIWTCPKTGLKVPKHVDENIEWRGNLLKNAENDPILQRDLMSACSESLLFWINAFAWTFHQFDTDSKTGRRMKAVRPHSPFITWVIQDDLCCTFEDCFEKSEDILVDKSRDMGASWVCVNFIHWLWLFENDAQLLEMSRTEDYVDKPGNMKALFQKHDYMNGWLPEWMLPPDVFSGQKNRTKMHMKNVINGACIDGESTTPNAGSGDRREVLLLDEFAKVEKGSLMRSATRDVGRMKIINSTPAGPGTEYSRWKQGGQIKVFILPFYEHPEKGAGRYIRKTETGGYEIRSPYLDYEATVRTVKEMARELLRQDVESGDMFFTIENVDKHKFLFAREPRERYHIHFVPHTPNDLINNFIRGRDLTKVSIKKGKKGPLRVWTKLIMGRPDQAEQYIFGIDIGKGQGASNSVVSIKCKRTGEKIAEWRDANTPPYDMARIVVALAIWCGGRKPRSLPFLKWEKNGPGLEFGKLVVRDFKYPYFYTNVTPGKTVDKKEKKYGWHSSRDSKYELLAAYDRALAHGGFINHSEFGLEEMKMYVHYADGGIGPAYLIEENASAKKTHGDIVIADALTIDDKETGRVKHEGPKAPPGSCGYRKDKVLREKKAAKSRRNWRQRFDNGR